MMPSANAGDTRTAGCAVPSRLCAKFERNRGACSAGYPEKGRSALVRWLQLAALMLAAASCFAADSAIVGTWRLRVDRSSMRPTQIKNETVVITQKDAFTWHYVYDFEFNNGRKTHSEQDRSFDGKERPVNDEAVEVGEHWDERNWVTRRLREGLHGMRELDGEWHSEISADGKTQTVHRTTVTAKETIKEDIVFERAQ